MADFYGYSDVNEIYDADALAIGGGEDRIKYGVGIQHEYFPDVPVLPQPGMAPEAPQQAADMGILDKIGSELQKAYEGTVEPFVGAAAENPIFRGAAQGAAKIPDNVLSAIEDVGTALGLPEPEKVRLYDQIDWGQASQYPNLENLTSSLVQFLGPYKALGGGKTGAITKEDLAKGGVADALFNPEEGNLGTVMREMGIDNEFTQFLDSKVGADADAYDRLEARAKQVLEGAGLSFALEGIMTGAKAAKSFLKKSPLEIDGVEITPEGLTANAAKKHEMHTPQYILAKYVNALSGKDTKGGACHTAACNYVSIEGFAEGDKLVMLKTGDRISHTIVVDKKGNLKFDEMKGSWNNKSKTWARTEKTPKDTHRIPYEFYAEVPIDPLMKAAQMQKGQ
jgi:hypothetical protein